MIYKALLTNCTGLSELYWLICKQLKCGACGQVGHMRTNKECPLYAKTEEELNYQKRGRKPLHLPSVQVRQILGHTPTYNVPIKIGLFNFRVV